jgi:hypothetical protein
MAVQPYLYTPENNANQVLGLVAHADCNPQRYIIQIEYRTTDIDEFYPTVFKFLESFRCDLEPHFWFYELE